MLKTNSPIQSTPITHPATLGKVATRATSEPVVPLPLAAFMAYTLAIISYRLPIGGLALAAAGGLVFIHRRGRVSWPAPLKVVLLLTVWFIVSSIGTRYPTQVSKALTEDWPKILVIFFVALNVLESRRQARIYSIFLLCVFLLFPVRGAIFNWMYGYSLNGRALWNGEFANPNSLGALCLLQVSIAAGLVASEPRKGVVWWGAMTSLAILPTVILMTASRGAVIRLATLALVAFLGTKGKKLRLWP